MNDLVATEKQRTSNCCDGRIVQVYIDVLLWQRNVSIMSVCLYVCVFVCVGARVCARGVKGQ